MLLHEKIPIVLYDIMIISTSRARISVVCKTWCCIIGASALLSKVLLLVPWFNLYLYKLSLSLYKAREEREAGMMTISAQPREEASYSRLKALTHYHAPAGREALLAARHREKRAQVRSSGRGFSQLQWSGVCWEAFHLRICHPHLLPCHCSVSTSTHQHH